MKYLLHTFFSIGLLYFLNVEKVSAEIKIKFPSDRAVFQRDKNNRATIYISGIYTRIIDRVEAKLTPINGGAEVGWETIQSNLQGGAFSGSLNAQGGWYRLEVRGWKGGQLVDHHQLERVGVGEVFLVAGQSNGQGYFDRGAPRAEDDRVSCIDHDNVNDGNENLPYPQFAHLESNSRISPRGRSAWSWGKLGDLLVARLGVPVLFYNAAWYGSSSRNWRESSNGGATNSDYDPSQYYNPIGSPYGMMKAVLRYYVPITGIRGVLWLQGEADNDMNTSADTYFHNIREVIDRSRSDSGKNLSWMVSLTSFSNRAGVDNQVNDGQRRVISSVSNVFEGPDTDKIQIPRIDREGVHFEGGGLSQLGEAWGNQLNDDFFSRSEPHPGVRPLPVTIACAGNNTVTLNIPQDGYNTFSWNNGQNSNHIQVGNGSYRATARDQSGNIIVSPEIEIYESIQPRQPIISIQGSNPVCRGNTSVLISSANDGIRWNTGSESDRLPVTDAGEFSVNVKNVYGCENNSVKVSISVLDSPLPQKPTITASGAVVFCDGGEVKLTSSSTVKSVWSNGAGDAVISVKSSGDYKVSALDDKGCYSPESDVVAVKVNPLPARPVISLDRSATFCANEQIVLTSSYDTGNTWSTSATSKAITVNTSGDVTLKQTDVNGCVSNSDPVTIKVNPLPSTPTITPLRPATFCERDYTVLQASPAYIHIWSNGSNNREIEVRESADFTLNSRDENGCLSLPSAVVRVTKNPLPPIPKITPESSTTFCANLSVNLTADNAPGYLWSNGATTRTVNITTEGTFRVVAISQFNCRSDASDPISTRVLLLPPSPTISALGVTTFCDGDFVNLVATKGSTFYWNNGEENDTIRATKTADYAARIRDDAGCYSPWSNTIAVDAKPQPTVPVIQKTGVYSLFAKNNLTDGFHVWRFNGKTIPDNTASIKATESGSYSVSNTVVYSPVLSCTSAFSDFYVLFVDPNDQFVVYPNPTSNGRVTVETLKNVTNARIQVLDLKGVVRKSYQFSSFKNAYGIDLSDLSSGLYIVRFESAVLNKVQKISVVK
jgi:hypothetical protein